MIIIKVSESLWNKGLMSNIDRAEKEYKNSRKNSSFCYARLS